MFGKLEVPDLPPRNTVRRFRKIAKDDYWIRHVRPSAWNNFVPTGHTFIKLYIRVFFENLSRKFKLH